jgi:hypothetical protein
MNKSQVVNGWTGQALSLWLFLDAQLLPVGMTKRKEKQMATRGEHPSLHIFDKRQVVEVSVASRHLRVMHVYF